ncbi:MAG: hypothetical protein HYX55_09735 [Chloroflexi bacterium]|nr:hypothetical protein [Chloroflexota bacterium]
MRPSHRRLAAFAALVLAIAVPSLASASNSWGGYHWARTSNPFTLKLGNNLNPTWSPILATTSNDWSTSTVLDTTIVAGQASTRKKCNPTGGRVEVCNNTYGNNGWLGVAQIWASGTHITQGTVRLNDSYFNTSAYNTSAWRNLVSCQEVGHTLGLDHQDTNFNNANLGSCMDYTNNPSTNQHPNQHDYDELGLIYNHTDSTSTIGSALPNASGADIGSWNAEFGRMVARSSDGRTSTFVRDLGAGQRIITHVIWA